MNSSQGMNPNEGGNPFAMAASSNAGDGNSKLGHWNEVQRLNGQLEFQIEDLDKKLNRVLAKQEYEYLKGYNIYVKQKEKDLRELIEKLNEKNSNNTLKDEKISKLESTIGAIREDQIRQEKEKEKLNENIKYWKTKAQGYEQEKNFLQQQIMDAKRQNKLLKLAIGRL
jgi:chromosome segregation ATPase